MAPIVTKKLTPLLATPALLLALSSCSSLGNPSASITTSEGPMACTEIGASPGIGVIFKGFTPEVFDSEEELAEAQNQTIPYTFTYAPEGSNESFEGEGVLTPDIRGEEASDGTMVVYTPTGLSGEWQGFTEIPDLEVGEGTLVVEVSRTPASDGETTRWSEEPQEFTVAGEVTVELQYPNGPDCDPGVAQGYLTVKVDEST